MGERRAPGLAGAGHGGGLAGNSTVGRVRPECQSDAESDAAAGMSRRHGATRSVEVEAGISYTDTAMYPRETLEAFDALLGVRGLRLDGVVIGGAALSLLGVISRETKDFDILSPPLDSRVLEASKVLAAQIRRKGGVLSDDWLNNGPATLASDLPAGWEARLQLVFRADCIALRPMANELVELLPWLEVRDLHPGWPAHVRETVEDLGRRLGHAL